MPYILTFTPTELTDKARAFLEQRFVQEDYKSYGCSIEAIIDEICQPDSIFSGVKMPPTFNWKKKRLVLADLPPIWWKAMAFHPKMERAMKVFWKKHPTGEVKWEW